MRPYLWPEDGWPYPDGKSDLPDLDSNIDEDAMVLRGLGPRLFDWLDPLERQVITAHYGLDGAPPRSMKELHHQMGISRTQLRDVLAGGLAKLRDGLSE
jgi:DNA-directed RNA polymerase sigma subunit (sigma70/sigma32)